MCGSCTRIRTSVGVNSGTMNVREVADLSVGTAIRHGPVLVATEGEQAAADPAQHDATVVRDRPRKLGVLERAQRDFRKRGGFGDGGRPGGDGRGTDGPGKKNGGHEEGSDAHDLDRRSASLLHDRPHGDVPMNTRFTRRRALPVAPSSDPARDVGSVLDVDADPRAPESQDCRPVDTRRSTGQRPAPLASLHDRPAPAADPCGQPPSTPHARRARTRGAWPRCRSWWVGDRRGPPGPHRREASRGHRIGPIAGSRRGAVAAEGFHLHHLRPGGDADERRDPHARVPRRTGAVPDEQAQPAPADPQPRDRPRHPGHIPGGDRRHSRVRSRPPPAG